MLAHERIGRYELVAHLAAGGMGQIYLARSSGLGGFQRHVVIKTLDLEDADEDEAAAMFLDEARLLGLLHHQHIAPVYEVDRDESGRLYLVMDYVHGHSGHDVWTRTIEIGAALPIDFTLTVVSASASGLHYAHTRRSPDGKPLQIVHRDVSMSNLMIGFDGAVKLIDFGIAKATNRSTKTQVGFVKGKVGYMAPEQLRGQEVDARTDVFALGIVLYELSTMRRAFREESDRATMDRIRSGNLVLPSTFISDYPPELERIVTRALRVDPRERYPDAESLRREVEALGHALGLVLGDAAIVEVMSQLYENQREPWQLHEGRGQTELEVPLEIVPPQRVGEKTRLRAATEAADALMVELGNAPRPTPTPPSRPTPTPRPNGIVMPLRGPTFDSGGVTIAGIAGTPDDEANLPTAVKGSLPRIDSERVTLPGEVGKDSEGVEIVPASSSRTDFDGGALPLPPPPKRPANNAPPVRPTKRVARPEHDGRARLLGWSIAAVALIGAVGVAVLVMKESGGGAAQASGEPSLKPADAAPQVAAPARAKGSAEPMPPVVQPPPTTVALKITTTPSDATVLLDGKRLGKTPFQGKVDASPGAHVIKIRRRGYATTKLDVELLGDLVRDVELVRSRGE